MAPGISTLTHLFTYLLRCVVDSYVKNGTMVNICALDLSKAFDKMNHYGLFVRLVQIRLYRLYLSLFCAF